MNSYIIGQLFETITVVAIGLCFVAIIIGSLYDIWMIRQQKFMTLQTKYLQRHRPHITVLVYVQHEGQVMIKCLTSILANRYRQYDIVLINNKLTDDTAHATRLFQQAHPGAHVRVLNKRKASSVRTALLQAYAKSQRGDIVLTLRSDTIVSKNFIKQSVAHFYALSAPQTGKALVFNTNIASVQGLTLLLQQFSLVNRHLVEKIRSFLHTRASTIDAQVARTSQPVMYAKSDFIKRSSASIHYVYDSRIAVMTTSTVHTFISQRVSKSLYLFATIAVLYVTYCVYMAASLQNTFLLFYGWLLIVVWYFAATWSDDRVRIPDKIRLSFALPSLYFLLYVTTSIAVIIVFTRLLVRSLRVVLRRVNMFYASQPMLFQD